MQVSLATGSATYVNWSVDDFAFLPGCNPKLLGLFSLSNYQIVELDQESDSSLSERCIYAAKK